MDNVEKVYRDVDFKVLPECFSDWWKNRRTNRHGLEMLHRLLPGIAEIEAFKESYAPTMDRDVEIQDLYDLAAYMILNSSYTLDRSDELDWAISKMKYMSSVSGKAIKLLEKCREDKERELVEYTLRLAEPIQRFHSEANALVGFYRTNMPKLREPKEFVDDINRFSITDCKFFFDRLSLQDKMDIANGKWRTEYSLKNTYYLLFISLFFGVVHSSELSKQHPYLIAIRAQTLEIVSHIRSLKLPLNEMKEMCKNFAVISKISPEVLICNCFQGNNRDY